MQASKVQITPMTHQMNALTSKRKREIREQRVIDFIKNKPAGTVISFRQFQRLLDMKHENSARVFVLRMVREGKIGRRDSERFLRSSEWFVNDGSVQQPAKVEQPAKASQGLDAAQLIELAKQYAWERDSNSLRGFVQWFIDKGEKQ